MALSHATDLVSCLVIRMMVQGVAGRNLGRRYDRVRPTMRYERYVFPPHELQRRAVALHHTSRWLCTERSRVRNNRARPIRQGLGFPRRIVGDGCGCVVGAYAAEPEGIALDIDFVGRRRTMFHVQNVPGVCVTRFRVGSDDGSIDVERECSNIKEFLTQVLAKCLNMFFGRYYFAYKSL